MHLVAAAAAAAAAAATASASWTPVSALCLARPSASSSPASGSAARCERGSRSGHIVCMNRLLLEPDECVTQPDGGLEATLASDDRRAQHVARVLRASDGDHLRAGVLDAGATDEARVRWVGGEGARGSSSLRLSLGPAERLLRPLELAARPRLDLLLAMPRPLQFGRLLPMIASMGVGTLWVTGARRVEKSYFSSHLLRKGNEAALRASLVEGLEQAGDTAVPRVLVARNLKRLLADELGGSGHARKLVCHPQREGEPRAPRLGDLPPLAPDDRLLLAVGPEGGWDEPAELDAFVQHGFEQATLGPRTLRTDTATVALLALAHDRLG